MVILVCNVTMGIKLINVGLMATAAWTSNVTVYFMVADVPVIAMITPTGEKRFAPRILRILLQINSCHCLGISTGSSVNSSILTLVCLCRKVSLKGIQLANFRSLTQPLLHHHRLPIFRVALHNDYSVVSRIFVLVTEDKQTYKSAV